MEQNTATKAKQNKTTAASTVGIRVKRETKRRILAELTKINKKDFGKKVKCDDLVGLALSLLSEHHIKALQEHSMTNADRLELQYRDYVRKHGAATKDEFLGKILSGQVAVSETRVTDSKIES